MKKSKNRRGSALAGLLSLSGADRGRVKTVEVTDEQPRETLRTFAQQENLRIAAENAAKQQAANVILAQKLFTEPSAELASRIPLFNRGERTEAQVMAACQAAVAGMKATLENQDVVLTDSGLQKLARIVMLQGNNALDFSTVISWIELFNYVDSIGAFAQGDIVDMRVQEQEAAPAPQAQNFDSLGDSEAKEAVLSAVQSDCREWYLAFEATLLRDFGFSFTDAQTAAVVNILKRGLVNYRSAKGWHTVRKSLVASGALPSNLLYPAEVFDDQIETLDLSDFEQKQTYAREFHRLQQLPNGGAAPQFAPA
jgi:hypothetical protein